MSLSLRSERWRIYTYLDAGADGLVASRYVFSAERWARREMPSGREQTLGAKADRQLDAVVAFGDEAVVGINDLLVRGSEQLKVVAVLPRPQMREIVCHCVLGDARPQDIVES